MVSVSAIADLVTLDNRPFADLSAQLTKNVRRIKPVDLSNVSKSVMGVAGSMRSAEESVIEFNVTVSNSWAGVFICPNSLFIGFFIFHRFAWLHW
jgi:hypothetical protein